MQNPRILRGSLALEWFLILLDRGKSNGITKPPKRQAKNQRSKFAPSATPLEGTMQSDSVTVERRRLPFTLIENVILEDASLGSVDILVYLAIAKHADSGGVCWPSQACIAKTARVHRATVAAALRHLETRGYLKRTARFKPNGAVTSNAYQLMPVEPRKYPPVAQDDTPHRPERLAPVAQDDTNYIHLELDPSKGSADNDTKKPVPTPLLPPLIQRMKNEAQARGAPPSFFEPHWTKGIDTLVTAGVSEQELLDAFTACIDTAPEKATYFPRDFLKWRKVSRSRTNRHSQLSGQFQQRDLDTAKQREERAQLLRDREDPYWQEHVAMLVAQLPWNKRKAKP